MSVEDRLARHGHVSYVEIPAVDAEQSAAFYAAVFGWTVRRRDNGDRSFDEPGGDLIGRWVTCREVSREPGIMLYIYVDPIDDVVERIAARGGEIVKPPYPEGDVWVATFRDPAGNLLGVWQAGRRKQ
jgi:predicted enzyme related to lactoylglutathione lyase